jgi:ATP-binding cassette subfamily B protein
MGTSPFSKNLASFIWHFVRSQKWTFFAVFFLSLVWSLDATIWPYILGRIIDILTLHDEGNRSVAWPLLKTPLLYGALLWVFVECSFRSKGFLQAKAYPRIEAEIRMAMFDHIQHHSPKYFNSHFTGSLSNKINDMTIQVTLILQNLLTLFLPTLATCVLTIFFFAQVNTLFAVIASCWIIIHLSICLAFTKRCARFSAIHGEARSSLAGKIVDSLSNNFAVNLFSRFCFEKARIAVYQKEEQTKYYQSKRSIEMMFVFVSTAFLLGGLSLNGFMILYWMQGKISTGEVIQIFNTTWNLIFILWFSGEEMPQFFQSIGIASQALTVMQDPKDVLDKPEAKELTLSGGNITFENVSFHYGDRKLFRNKDVSIRGGEKVGLVGYSGSGKTTFVNLILRFYPLESGRILIDGQDIAGVTIESLRGQIALIPQDPGLFHRTLEDNIRYGKIDASKEEILEAAKKAHCDEFIQNLPAGYDTLVGERGTKLSGGERQRIAIARAMLTSAPILILDEATSALDSVTEQYIQESLEKLIQNRTTIVIAHRLSTLAKMDRILVFDEGKIVEEGSHLELLSKGGYYSRMWQMQAGGFLPDNPDKQE